MDPVVSAIVLVSERYDDVASLYRQYRSSLDSSGLSYEIIYVLDGVFPEVREQLTLLRGEGETFELIELGKWYGESTALNVALDQARGEIILTLPAYAQVDPECLDGLLRVVLNNEADVALAVRHPRRDSAWNRIQARIFRGMANWISDSNYRDIGCGVRAFSRCVFEDVPVYGDLHRFLPLLASRSGFKVAELETPQSGEDLARRIYRPGVYSRRFLDLLTVFFLVKFTKKPLRFFGLLGLSAASVGGAVLAWLLVERLFFDISLGDRPALLLSTLMFAIGVQLVAVGLIGELIIFSYALNLKEYKVEKVSRLDSDHGALD